MQGDDAGNESRRDGFEVAFEFSEGDIASEILFVNALEGTQKVAHISPKTLDGIDMDFPDAIAIIVTSPLIVTVADSRTRAQDVIVALIFIGIEMRAPLREAVDMVL